MKRNKTIDEYLASVEHFREEVIRLREIMLQSGLEETIKWGIPVYTLEGKNIVGISSFKTYFGMWFYQGVFLRDPAGVLMNAQEGVTKGMRQWRLTSMEEIDEELIMQYIQEAIQNQREGKEIKPERKALLVPPALDEALDQYPDARLGFDALSHSKKREYTEYISEAKRAETKQNRLAKILPMLEQGIGLNDKYRSK